MSLFDAAPTPSASRVSTPRGRPADEPPLSREAEPEAEPLATPADAAEYRAALAAFRTGAWPQERWTTFRLRHGVYAQAQADTYMVRAKLPGGRLSFDQARAVAVANRDHCGAAVHLTTRQDVQFYYLTLDGTADLLAALARGGVTTREASGNTFRNVSTCPLAAVCTHEHVDAAQVAERLATAWIRHPLTQHMPRKFKTTVSGCGHDCGMARIDDLGLIATVKD
ncbi:MAG: hypothetical protein KDE22_17075, partial [Rhodobacterales bacterium]|nr:hypothetical protein [Rhodobacterales bacterium]